MKEFAGVATDRPQREIEGLIENARKTDSHLHEILERVRDMRMRLLGMEEEAPKDPNIKEVIGCELHHLRDVMRQIDGKIQTLGTYISNLESV